MILYIALGVIGFLVFGGILTAIDASKFNKKATLRIKAMEAKFEEYVDKKLAIQVIDNSELHFEMESLTEELMQILKPDLDGLINLINASSMSSASLKYDSKYFPNLVSLSEEGIKLSEENEEKRLSTEEREQFTVSLKDAIEANLQHRYMMLNSGEI